MVDICKCKNDECELRFKCYRFTAKSGMRQYWAWFEPKNGKCEDFLSNNN